MTLVIAGHDIKRDVRKTGYRDVIHGLFVVADSTITDGYQTLLKGFKKIYEVPIKVYKPNFNGTYFKSYSSVRLETNCFIAFAGSTVIAQHVLNGINNHMSVLRYGYEGSGPGKPGTYQILMDCELNRLHNSTTQWGDDMFLNTDMEELLSGEVIVRVVLHAIQCALDGSKQYKIDERGWKSLLTQYVIGTYCEEKKSNRLFTVIPAFRRDAGVIVDIDLTVKEIPPGELAVLGMTQFSSGATTAFNRALGDGADVKHAMFDYLNEAIDKVQQNNKSEIDRPAFLKGYSQGKLELLDKRT